MSTKPHNREYSPNELYYEEVIGLNIISLGVGYLIWKLVRKDKISDLPRLRMLRPRKIKQE